MIRSLFLVLLFMVGTCAAQTVAWKAPVYFDDFADDEGIPAVLRPAFDKRSSMLFSGAGVPGSIAAGSMETDDGDLPVVAKLSKTDGRSLWRWTWSAPGAIAPSYGRIFQAAVDPAGQVFVTGTVNVSSEHVARSFLAKLDGASGTELWRIYGDARTYGYSAAVDDSGNIVVASIGVTFSGSVGASAHIIEKHRGDTGALIWSTSLPDGDSWYDDLRVVVDADGNAIMAGRYQTPSAPQGQSSVRIAKLRGSDGAVLWAHLSVMPQVIYGEVRFLQVVGSRDVLASVLGDGLLYLNSDGSTRWSRPLTDDFDPDDFAADSQRGIYFATSMPQTPGHDDALATFGRIDMATGADIWTARLSGGTYRAVGTGIGIGNDGVVLATWTYRRDFEPPTINVTALDESNGHANWTAPFGGNETQSSGLSHGVAQDADGSIFVCATTSDVGTGDTWTLFKITGSFSDDIFANGWDG